MRSLEEQKRTLTRLVVSVPPDSWISQSASAPRNQKQTGVDPPASSSPRGPGQTSSAQPRTVKVSTFTVEVSLCLSLSVSAFT